MAWRRADTPHLQPHEAGETCSRESDLKVVRDLGIRCGGFGFGELRDDAELLHKAQSVPVDPAFYHPAASEAGDAYPGDDELLPRWRDAAEIPFMGTPTGPTGHHCFAFGNDVREIKNKTRRTAALGRPERREQRKAANALQVRRRARRQHHCPTLNSSPGRKTNSGRGVESRFVSHIEMKDRKRHGRSSSITRYSPTIARSLLRIARYVPPQKILL